MTRQIVCLLFITANLVHAQSPENIQRPWDGVPSQYRNLPIGRLDIPSDLPHWREQRDRVKRIVVEALGDLPPRPSLSSVRTLSVDTKDGYRIERFSFDN